MRAELQHDLIYSIVVAGKSATFTDKVMGRWRAHCQHREPFQFIRILIEEDNLDWVLRDIRCGNYTKIARCFAELAITEIDLSTCTPADLERIHGIGPKTSRFFIIWTRPGAQHAALDVHVLRWLKARGYDAPRSTPNGTKYSELEQAFLTEARNAGMTPRELDEKIWKEGSGYRE
jgi:hypothetical protein